MIYLNAFLIGIIIGLVAGICMETDRYIEE